MSGPVPDNGGGAQMRKRLARWGLAVASSFMFIAPAFSARANDQQNQSGEPPIKDEWITSQIKQKLNAAVPGANDIDVNTKNDVVTLSGSVPTETARGQAVQVASQVPGIKQLKDEIKVHPGK
jgi:hyperosmotically inducible periplasmic protein